MGERYSLVETQKLLETPHTATPQRDDQPGAGMKEGYLDGQGTKVLLILTTG